jgi:hypothetical protein
MTIERLKESYDSQPFRLFVLHLADGREMAAPSERTLIVWQPDDRMNIIDLLLVTDVEIKPGRNGSRKKRRS